MFGKAISQRSEIKLDRFKYKKKFNTQQSSRNPNVQFLDVYYKSKIQKNRIRFIWIQIFSLGKGSMINPKRASLIVYLSIFFDNNSVWNPNCQNWNGREFRIQKVWISDLWAIGTTHQLSAIWTGHLHHKTTFKCIF